MSFFGSDALALAAWKTLTAPDTGGDHEGESSSSTKKVIMQRSGGSHFSETDDSIQLSVDIPGVKAKELFVKVEHSILTISGSRKIVLAEGGRKRFKFEKNFSIDIDSIDVDSITANLSNGVLILKAKKKKRSGPRIIEVTENDVEEDETEAEEDSKPPPVLTVKDDDDDDDEEEHESGK